MGSRQWALFLAWLDQSATRGWTHSGSLRDELDRSQGNMVGPGGPFCDTMRQGEGPPALALDLAQVQFLQVAARVTVLHYASILPQLNFHYLPIALT